MKQGLEMSVRLAALSALSLTAGAVIYFTFFYKKRRAENAELSSSSEESREAGYRPVTDVNEYTIIIISSLEEHQDTVEEFVSSVQHLKVLGLDCEWVTRDGVRRPVALLQISSPLTKLCLLFRLDQLQGQLPDAIKTILAHRGILKVGVGVVEDGKRLDKDYHIQVNGCLDLRQLALRHLMRRLRGRRLGLRDLANIILNHEMLKDDSIRCGNWEADPLTRAQVEYAARDAIIGTAIFMRIIAIKLKLNTFEEFLDERMWKDISPLCQGILDVVPNDVYGSPVRTSRKSKPKDLDSRPLSRAYKTMQKVMYHNCRLLAPDNRLLCTCDKRKALWYIDRGIGEMMEEEPLTVRLLFEPAGVPGPDREYYQLDKENRCVVCGREDSYVRKNVVPHEYRRHFPDYLKKHSSHDVILLCLRCHQKCSDYDLEIRQELAEKYDASISIHLNAKVIEDPERVRVRSCARALSRNQKQKKIPESRLKELTKVVIDFYDVDSVNDDLLQVAVAIDTKIYNHNFSGSHGLKVVEGAMKEEGGLGDFERMWRRNFLEKMEPKFMPELWSVDHKHEASVCKK